MNNRKIKKSYISCTGYFFSYKNNTQIAFESTLERDFYLSLEFDNDVIGYKEQPETIVYEYPDQGKRRYTPDTLVFYKDNHDVMFEVKYADDLENIDLQKKLEILKNEIKLKYGLELKVFTDKDLSTQYLENIRFLYKFAFIPQQNQKTELITQLLIKENSISITDIIHTIEKTKMKQLELIPYVWNYLFLNNKLTNLENKLSMNTILSTGAG